MYIFFSSSNTWSNVCMIYGCDIYNCDITISADTTFTSAPANQPQIERCDSAMNAEEEVSTNLIIWVSLHFEEKSVSAYRRKPKPTVQIKRPSFKSPKVFLSIDHNLHVWSSIWSLIFTTYSTSTNITFHTQSSFNNINKAI